MVVNLDASSAWVGSYTSTNSGVTNAGAASGDYPASGVYTLTVGATVTASYLCRDPDPPHRRSPYAVPCLPGAGTSRTSRAPTQPPA